MERERFDLVLPLPPAGVAFGVVCRGDEVAESAYLFDGTAPVAPRSPLARRVAEWVEAYLEAPATPCRLPLAPPPTPFQARLRQALLALPCGKTLTYGALAQRIGSSARAVGGGCGANPLPLLVPCHRVVAATGMGGFMGERSGAPAALKAWLLRHEGVVP